MTLLLLDAAKCFDELSNPFDAQWLADHSVTLDECGDLSEVIASAIKLYTYLPSDERLAFELKRAISESELPEDIKRYMNASLDFNQSLKRVKKIKGAR
jgi:hypothetical protein